MVGTGPRARSPTPRSPTAPPQQGQAGPTTVCRGTPHSPAMSPHPPPETWGLQWGLTSLSTFLGAPLPARRVPEVNGPSLHPQDRAQGGDQFRGPLCPKGSRPGGQETLWFLASRLPGCNPWHPESGWPYQRSRLLPAGKQGFCPQARCHTPQTEVQRGQAAARGHTASPAPLGGPEGGAREDRKLPFRAKYTGTQGAVWTGLKAPPPRARTAQGLGGAGNCPSTRRIRRTRAWVLALPPYLPTGDLGSSLNLSATSFTKPVETRTALSGLREYPVRGWTGSGPTAAAGPAPAPPSGPAASAKVLGLLARGWFLLAGGEPPVTGGIPEGRRRQPGAGPEELPQACPRRSPRSRGWSAAPHASPRGFSRRRSPGPQ